MEGGEGGIYSGRRIFRVLGILGFCEMNGQDFLYCRWRLNVLDHYWVGPNWAFLCCVRGPNPYDPKRELKK